MGGILFPLLFHITKGSLSYFYDPRDELSDVCRVNELLSYLQVIKIAICPSHTFVILLLLLLLLILCSSIYIYITLRNYLIDKCYAMSLYLQGADLFLLVYLYFHIYHCNL